MLFCLSKPGYAIIADGGKKIVSDAFCSNELWAAFPDADEHFLHDVLTGTSIHHIAIGIVAESAIPGFEHLLKQIIGVSFIGTHMSTITR